MVLHVPILNLPVNGYTMKEATLTLFAPDDFKKEDFLKETLKVYKDDEDEWKIFSEVIRVFSKFA